MGNALCNNFPLQHALHPSLFYTPSFFDMRSFFTLISLVVSATAYEITSPSNTSGWTSKGPDSVTYSWVTTDDDCLAILVRNVCSPLLYPPSSERPPHSRMPYSPSSSTSSTISRLLALGGKTPRPSLFLLMASKPGIASKSTSSRMRTT